MFYLGLDPSLTCCGAVLINDKNKICANVEIKTSSDELIEKRFIHISNVIFDIIDKRINVDPIDNLKIGIEGLSYGSKGQSIAELGTLHYFLRILFYDNNLKYVVVPPTVVKKYVCGTGQAKKDLMLLNAYKKFNIEFQSTDICDAYCIARFIQEYKSVENFVELTKPKNRKKVIDDAKK